jgi:hypothetical protein
MIDELISECIELTLLQGDEQYLSILTKCGARVLNLLSLPPAATAQQLLQEVQRQQAEAAAAAGAAGEDAGGGGSRTCSIFFEESKSPSAKVSQHLSLF